MRYLLKLGMLRNAIKVLKVGLIYRTENGTFQRKRKSKCVVNLIIIIKFCKILIYMLSGHAYFENPSLESFHLTLNEMVQKTEYVPSHYMTVNLMNQKGKSFRKWDNLIGLIT